jgi:hypothetical protein
MGLAIIGGVIAAIVGLGVLYDYINRRRGRDISISASGPINGNDIRGDSPPPPLGTGAGMSP